MSAKTSIQWTDRSWNPVRGCSLVSPGCTNCYAMKMAHRWSGAGQPYERLTRMTEHGPVWTGKIKLIERALEEPLSWKQPARIFVNSMSDLFHEAVSNAFIDLVFLVMAEVQHRHTFQVLTKRPARMLQYCNRPREQRPQSWHPNWPLPNVWLGVSVENQATADERIPILLRTPAAVRFLSVEPLLGPVELGDWLIDLDWVIVGGESGPCARACDLAWIRALVIECKKWDVRVFVKQLGANTDWSENGWCRLNDRHGGDPAEWPADLRVREFPE